MPRGNYHRLRSPPNLSPPQRHVTNSNHSPLYNGQNRSPPPPLSQQKQRDQQQVPYDPAQTLPLESSAQTSSFHTIPDINTTLTVKPYPFSGSVLTPKHARDLTPNLVLSITHALAEQALLNAATSAAVTSSSSYPSASHSHSNDSSTSVGVSNNQQQPPSSSYHLEPSFSAESQSHTAANHPASESKVQYTVWITEAWRVLGWAEPSAALFWEMATMYHTLHVAGRCVDVSTSVEEEHIRIRSDNGADMNGGIRRVGSQSIPPILSCGSSQSVDSQDSKENKGSTATTANSSNKFGSNPNRPGSPSNSVSSGYTDFSSEMSRNRYDRRGSSSSLNGTSDGKSQANSKSTAASAKELPVWLVGMFLLLHCEEEAFWRNVSGEDERRFDTLRHHKNRTGEVGEIWKDGLVGKGVDFGMLLLNPSLSPRTRIHAGKYTDNTHCTAYLLRHLRKFLLLSAIPHNTDALWAIMTLAETKSPHEAEYTDRQNPALSRPGSSLFIADQQPKPDADVLHRRHVEEHMDIGVHVRLSADDLERLNLVLQAPSGGLIDDPPLCIADIMPSEEMALYGGVLVEEAEREIRRHLEMDMIHLNNEDQSHEGKDDVDAAAKDMANLSMNKKKEEIDGKQNDGKDIVDIDSTDGGTLHHKDPNDYHKELSYTNLRGTTILLKPNSHPDNMQADSGNSVHSTGDLHNNPAFATNSRLHDLHVSNCSDAHMYLLQPFEHATISACTGCTIVVGSVAGLLNVVDCERTTITSAARRVMVSNCIDLLHCIFTPSPPLLVGDNRSCQFAPYNTYYDGLKEDLLATGLAAAIVTPDHIPYADIGVQGPTLQCASNKWKQPVELAKLEIPQVHPQNIASSSSSTGGAPGADDKALSKHGTGDDTMQTPILLPASDFHILFVPLESEADRLQRQEEVNLDDMVLETGSEDNSVTSGTSSNNFVKSGSTDSQYCRHLADVIQLSPFRLPAEYERRALVKAERMRSLQQAIQTDLTPEQQVSLQEELNGGFRDWLVTSGNLRQVLDLVHFERKSCV